MAYDNPFANFTIHIPTAYQERIKRFCSTGSGMKESPEYVPFERQVDLWFMALVLAVNTGQQPTSCKDNYNATSAAILSNDSYRSLLMQMIAISHYEDVGVLSDPRKVFDLCVAYANAGMPYLLDVLESDDTSPIWSLLEKVEELARHVG
ncbi:hypothetical protein [Stutzerimonas stutzeri]|jgi:hypothetical protein|uniref:hypothetical protein n=1 Tax=Stutzerimonas stutzeri TaxID=316 RepID=UPI0024480B95|nr:hypothetical protein [Stutzerimonas stutzeri]MDH0057074.1 hypothetical protein [Stutzerimonas stutzeri]